MSTSKQTRWMAKCPVFNQESRCVKDNIADKGNQREFSEEFSCPGETRSRNRLFQCLVEMNLWGAPGTSTWEETLTKLLGISSPPRRAGCRKRSVDQQHMTDGWRGCFIPYIITQTHTLLPVICCKLSSTECVEQSDGKEGGWMQTGREERRREKQLWGRGEEGVPSFSPKGTHIISPSELPSTYDAIVFRQLALPLYTFSLSSRHPRIPPVSESEPSARLCSHVSCRFVLLAPRQAAPLWRWERACVMTRRGSCVGWSQRWQKVHMIECLCLSARLPDVFSLVSAASFTPWIDPGLCWYPGNGIRFRANVGRIWLLYGHEKNESACLTDLF